MDSREPIIDDEDEPLANLRQQENDSVDSRELIIDDEDEPLANLRQRKQNVSCVSFCRKVICKMLPHIC